jgi:hypothetical protein
MRAVSHIAGLLTLVMVLAAGGAAMRPPPLVEVDLDPSVAEGFPASLPLGETSPLPVGCRPPLAGAVCVQPVVAGGLDVPASPYDLVPAEVASVQDWRPLVELYFRPEHVDRALRIIACESRGDPAARNPRSSATGLFQHLARLWPSRAAAAGWEGASITDPVANVAVAAWLVYEGGGWSHWYPSRGCW